MGEAKIVFSANLQETLGISMYEGALAGAIPIVPDRLSYSEMYTDDFKYPSDSEIMGMVYKVLEVLHEYPKYEKKLKSLLKRLDGFFSANKMINKLIQ